MKITPLTELMHAVLDGEATSEETRELERPLLRGGRIGQPPHDGSGDLLGLCHSAQA